MSAEHSLMMVPQEQAAISPLEQRRLMEDKYQEMVEAAAEGAPISWQMKLQREFEAMRQTLLVGMAGSRAHAIMADTAHRAASDVMLWGQIYQDGLAGKVPSEDLTVLRQITRVGLEAIAEAQVTTAVAVNDQIDAFETPDTTVRNHDVVWGVLTETTPSQLAARRQRRRR